MDGKGLILFQGYCFQLGSQDGTLAVVCQTQTWNPNIPGAWSCCSKWRIKILHFTNTDEEINKEEALVKTAICNCLKGRHAVTGLFYILYPLISHMLNSQFHSGESPLFATVQSKSAKILEEKKASSQIDKISLSKKIIWDK